MNHRTALQRSDLSGWVMGERTRSGTWAIGYCAEQKHVHDTEEAARDCYGDYQRDHVRLDMKLRWTSCQVQGCKDPANQAAFIEGDGYSLAPLCERHLTHETAIQELNLTGPAGDSWYS